MITWKKYLKQNFDDKFNELLQNYDPSKKKDYDEFHSIIWAESYSEMVVEYNNLNPAFNKTLL